MFPYVIGVANPYDKQPQQLQFNDIWIIYSNILAKNFEYCYPCCMDLQDILVYSIVYSIVYKPPNYPKLSDKIIIHTALYLNSNSILETKYIKDQRFKE